jgi:hypothetical protein
MGGPGLATKHLSMRVPMTEFLDYHEFRCLRRLSPRDRVLPFPLAEKLGLAATSVQPVFYGARRFTHN